MKRIGVFADVSNLYYCIGMKYADRKLDYAAYLKYVKELGLLKVAYAYGAQLENEAAGFIHCLKSIGFIPKYKTPKTYRSGGQTKHKADWDVGIAMDIVQEILNLDIIILGSADGDLCPAVEWAQRHRSTLIDTNIKVIVLACGISRELRDLADQAIEIPESLLEKKDGRNKTIQRSVSDSGKRVQSDRSRSRPKDKSIPLSSPL